eukprot:7343659-Prymnesium_polylepis.3
MPGGRSRGWGCRATGVVVAAGRAGEHTVDHPRRAERAPGCVCALQARRRVRRGCRAWRSWHVHRCAVCPAWGAVGGGARCATGGGEGGRCERDDACAEGRQEGGARRWGGRGTPRAARPMDGHIPAGWTGDVGK